MSDITRLLNAVGAGDSRAAGELLPLVYAELRRLAAAQMAREKPGHTLDATALVHEAYLRLAGPDGAAHFANRRHFFAAAAEAMRRVLVENARRKRRRKRGGDLRRVELPDVPAAREPEYLLALDEALTRLAAEDALAARVVDLRYFAGLGHEGIAETLGITVYQARQKWTYARAWLKDALGLA
jgi:RNA polymerase sigma factor (TIGR02999 family)